MTLLLFTDFILKLTGTIVFAIYTYILIFGGKINIILNNPEKPFEYWENKYKEKDE